VTDASAALRSGFFPPNDIKKPVIIGLFCGFVLFKKMNHLTVYDLNMRDPLLCFCFEHDL
jgi:hypothetical protein